MGSFAYTCCISGFPIHGGDSIRYFLLTQYPFYEKIDDACTMTGIWVPRTFPLQAKYDDYGRATEVEEGPAKEVWRDGFQYDLLERGTGDNSVHDVPVRKGMSFEKLMLAVQESRLRVKMTTFSEERLSRVEAEARKLLSEELPKKAPHPSIPTIKRVRRILKRAGFKVADQGFNGGYLINRKSFGFIRVRNESNSDALEQLALIQHILGERFGVEISIGTGAYSNGPMLVVTPKFSTDPVVPPDTPLPFEEGRRFRNGCKKKKLLVAHAMIREDVWQALLKINPARVEAFKKQAQDMCEKIQEDRSKLQLTHFQSRFEGNEVGSWVRDQFCIGHESHYQLFLDRNPSEDELTRFLDTIAETVFIQSILSSTRYQWRPSTSVGPQFGEWGRHVALLKALTGVAKQCNSQARKSGW